MISRKPELSKVDLMDGAGGVGWQIWRGDGELPSWYSVKHGWIVCGSPLVSKITTWRRRAEAERVLAYLLQPSTIDKTAQGLQHVIPGAARISERERLERRMGGALKPLKPQKPADEGLFDVAGRGQGELFK